MLRVRLACLELATIRHIIGLGLTVISGGGLDDILGYMMILTMVIEVYIGLQRTGFNLGWCLDLKATCKLISYDIQPRYTNKSPSY